MLERKEDKYVERISGRDWLFALNILVSSDDNFTKKNKLKHINLNAVSEQNQLTLMLGACLRESTTAIDFLLAEGIDINSNHQTVDTPVTCLVSTKKATILKYLLEKKADPNQARRDGCRPLHLAAAMGDPISTNLLIHYNASVSATDHLGSTSFHYCMKSMSSQVLLALLKANASAPENERALFPLELLFTTIHQKKLNPSNIKLFLGLLKKYGIDFNAINLPIWNKKSALLLPQYFKNHMDLFKGLLDICDVNQRIETLNISDDREKSYKTILFNYLQNSEDITLEMVEQLLNHDKTDLTSLASHEINTIHFACTNDGSHHSIKILELLLSTLKRKNLLTGLIDSVVLNFDQTPLMIVAKNNQSDMVKLLLDHGANANFRRMSDNASAMELAHVKNHPQIVCQILTHIHKKDVIDYYFEVNEEDICTAHPLFKKELPAPSPSPKIESKVVELKTIIPPIHKKNNDTPNYYKVNSPTVARKGRQVLSDNGFDKEQIQQFRNELKAKKQRNHEKKKSHIVTVPEKKSDPLITFFNSRIDSTMLTLYDPVTNHYYYFDSLGLEKKNYQHIKLFQSIIPKHAAPQDDQGLKNLDTPIPVFVEMEGTKYKGTINKTVKTKHKQTEDERLYCVTVISDDGTATVDIACIPGKALHSKGAKKSLAAKADSTITVYPPPSEVEHIKNCLTHIGLFHTTEKPPGDIVMSYLRKTLGSN